MGHSVLPIRFGAAISQSRLKAGLQRCSQPMHPLRHRDLRLIAQVAAGGGDVEVVAGGELGGEEAGHAGFVDPPGEFPDSFQHGPGGIGGAVGDGLGDGRNTGESQNFVDPVPAVHRLSVGDEVRPAAGRRTGLELPCRQEMGRRGVLDVDGVNQVLAGSHAAKLAGAGAGQETGDEMLVSRPPNEMRTEGTSEEIRVISREYLLLRQGLGVRIMGQPAGWIRSGFIDVALISSREGDAGAAGVDQPGDVVFPAGGNDVPGSQRVDAVVRPPLPPNAGNGGDMKNGVDAAAGILDRSGILNVALQRFHAEFTEKRILAASQGADLMPLTDKLPRNSLAEKAPCPGN